MGLSPAAKQIDFCLAPGSDPAIYLHLSLSDVNKVRVDAGLHNEDFGFEISVFAGNTKYPVDVVKTGVFGDEHVSHEALGDLLAVKGLAILLQLPCVISGHVDATPGPVFLEPGHCQITGFQ
ncbi:MAG: hypothetical protein JRI34_12050 [Deltaproteobacteria bacterium]|nr:hypothetical protein [Deltaproteobacteria bacterium]